MCAREKKLWKMRIFQRKQKKECKRNRKREKCIGQENWKKKLKNTHNCNYDSPISNTQKIAHVCTLAHSHSIISQNALYAASESSKIRGKKKRCDMIAYTKYCYRASERHLHSHRRNISEKSEQNSKTSDVISFRTTRDEQSKQKWRRMKENTTFCLCFFSFRLFFFHSLVAFLAPIFPPLPFNLMWSGVV